MGKGKSVSSQETAEKNVNMSVCSLIPVFYVLVFNTSSFWLNNEVLLHYLGPIFISSSKGRSVGQSTKIPHSLVATFLTLGG